jgi:hypothetical protein
MSKKPTLTAYSIREGGKGQKDIWTRIGARLAAQQRYQLQHPAQALPMGDRIVLTEPKADEPKSEEAEALAEAE